MIKVKLYEELSERDMDEVECEKGYLRAKLYALNEMGIYKADDFVIRYGSEKFSIYVRNDDSGIKTIHIYPAARIRLETDFGRFENDISRINRVLSNFMLDQNRDKYCLLKHIDFQSDFLITDIYIEM